MTPAPKFASYIIHLIARAESLTDEFERLTHYDSILDILEGQPVIWGSVLADSMLPLDNYLSLRPENLDRIIALNGRVESGLWYAFPDVWMDSLEIAIRNLFLGITAARLLNMPTFATPLPAADLPITPQIPQLLMNFDIRAGLQDSGLQPDAESSAKWVSGMDGSAIGVFQIHPGEVTAWQNQRDQFAESAAGRHLITAISGHPNRWIQKMESLRESLKNDDVFFSSQSGMAKAALMNMGTPPWARDIMKQYADVPGIPGISKTSDLQKLLLQQIEPLTVYAAYNLPDNPLKQPQRILQQLWRKLIRALAEGDSAALKNVQRQAESLLKLYPKKQNPISQLFDISNPDIFHIMAVKLHDDGQPGIVVRGYNPTGQELPLKLKPWRNFSKCAVLRLDEQPTGGQLPVNENGVIEFFSLPHRILTLGLS